MLSTGTQSDLLAAGQLLKQYNGALQSQLSRHQHAAHILQALLSEQVRHCDSKLGASFDHLCVCIAPSECLSSCIYMHTVVTGMRCHMTCGCCAPAIFHQHLNLCWLPLVRFYVMGQLATGMFCIFCQNCFLPCLLESSGALLLRQTASNLGCCACLEL